MRTSPSSVPSSESVSLPVRFSTDFSGGDMGVFAHRGAFASTMRVSCPSSRQPSMPKGVYISEGLKNRQLSPTLTAMKDEPRKEVLAKVLSKNISSRLPERARREMFFDKTLANTSFLGS